MALEWVFGNLIIKIENILHQLQKEGSDEFPLCYGTCTDDIFWIRMRVVSMHMNLAHIWEKLILKGNLLYWCLISTPKELFTQFNINNNINNGVSNLS